MTDSLTVHDPEELRDRRMRAGLNQDELAALSGLSQSYISLLERGQKNPTAKTLRLLAGALPECQPGDLMRKRRRQGPKFRAPARATTGRAA
jgi:transcriptional regulator with XRE-family HTH domain